MLKKVRAQKKAEKLLVDCRIKKIPTDLQKIAKKVKVEIFENDFPSDTKISAILLKEGKKKAIAVNKANPESRKRFSIAHEIGHLILHSNEAYLSVEKELEEKYLFLRSKDSSDIIEMEANQFASALLMPAESLEEDFHALFYKIDDEDIIRTLAEKYKVSKTAMMYRLMNLKLV